MGEKQTICPGCGKSLDPGEAFCPECGAKNEPEATDSTQPDQPTTSIPPTVSTWKKIEDYVSLAGQFAWILLIFHIVIAIIWNIILATGGNLAWGIIRVLALLGLSAIFMKEFSEKCKARDWHFLINDVIVIGGYRIPKMLFFGILLTIFAEGWGSALVIGVALLVIFMGPEEMVWKSEPEASVEE